MEQVQFPAVDGHLLEFGRQGESTAPTTQGQQSMVADIGREDQRMQDVGCAGNAEGGVSAVLRDGEAGHGDRGAKRLSREGMSHDIGCIFWILDFGYIVSWASDHTC